jgi:diacylglycerol kinase (ATP)
MRAVLLVNKRSGRGRAAARAAALAEALRARGWSAASVDIGAPATDVHAACRGSDALLAVGGDGTVRGALPFALKHAVPLGILPTGTENLAARALGFPGAPRDLADAVAAGRRRAVDCGRANLLPFLVMASVGLDADIVWRVHQTRRGAIRRWAYLGAALGLLRGWRAPTLRVTADGQRVFTGPGMLVVANCAAYAGGLDPVRGADPADGHLDYTVLPALGAADAARWAVRLARAGWSGEGAVRGSARRVVADIAPASALQADGDPIGEVRAASLAAEVAPGALRLVDARAVMGAQELPEQVQELPIERR